jgi:uncharacterized membrane-anchored protein
MATITAIRSSGRGRQSTIVERLRDDRDELVALMDEGRELGLLIVALARRAQTLIAIGQSAATILDQLEHIGSRQANRMTAAIAHAHVGDACMDGSDELGHGRAA